MRELKNGFLTGMMLQLAVGPVFFYITNLAMQKTFLDGLAGVLAVTSVDYLYITLSILGVGKLLEKEKNKKILGWLGPAVLVIFGVITLRGVFSGQAGGAASTGAGLAASFSSVFALTASSPLTIVFFGSLFTARAVEFGYGRRQLVLFGAGTGFATFAFMGSAIILFTMVKQAVPLVVMQVLNGLVGLLLVGYGLFRLYKNGTA